MLDKIDEIELIHQIVVTRKKRVQSGYNFECPFCNEGDSRGRKRRGYFLYTNPRENNRFYCHNCHISLNIKNFLKEYDESLYKDYIEKERQNALDNFALLRKKRKLKLEEETQSDVEPIEFDTTHLFPVIDYQIALQYCERRKIPEEIINGLYYCTYDENLPKDFKAVQGCIIFPFYAGSIVYGWQARSIHQKYFHNHVQEGFKVYNIFNLDLESSAPIHIHESIIDSLFIHRSIAMLGAGGLSDAIKAKIKNPIYCFDNDRATHTYSRMLKYVEEGAKVVIWPDTMKYKDIGDMVHYGLPVDTIKSIIDSNIHSGLEAKTRIGLLQSKKKGLKK